jgi:hypothetical protein
MFHQPQTYPLVPQKVKDFLRQIEGVTVPKFIKGDEVRVLNDIQVVKVGNVAIPIYSTVEDVWVDAVYDSWIKVGKIDSPEIREIASQTVMDADWWII